MTALTDRDGALRRLKIIEIEGGYASAYCTHLLSGLGAQVIKIEQPGGDFLRRMGPWPAEHYGDADWGLPHLWLDAGKSSVVCDISVQSDLDQFHELMCTADAVVANVPVANLKPYGICPKDFSAKFSKTVFVTISAFGSSGPWSTFRGYHLNAAASGGGCFFGSIEREPLAVPGLQGHVQAGTHAAGALLAILHDIDAHGGDWIDISESDLWCAHIGGFRVHSVVRDGVSRPRYARRNPTLYPFGLYPCRDGYILEVALRGAEWKRFLKILGNGEVPDWAKDSRFANRRANARLHVDELDARQMPWLSANTREEIFNQATAQRLAFAPIYNFQEVLGSEHLRQRSFFASLELPDGRKVDVPGVPYRLSRTPARSPVGTSPTLGSATARVFGRQAPEVHNARPFSVPQEPRAPGKRVDPPLAGIRVLDFGNVIAGPACARMLGDFGAEVVKVESAHHIDAMRSSEANRSGDLERDPAYHFVNRGKKGITLDFTSTKGRDLILALAAKCDVVLENFAPRVLPKNRLDYAAFAAVNPGIIMLSMPGAGDSGPLRDIVAYGNVTAALSGMSSMSGYAADDLVFPPGLYSDWNSAAHGFVAVMAALHHRDHTGEGQYINLSQWEVGCASMGTEFLTFTAGGIVPVPMGNRDPSMAPHNLYPTQGSGWVAIVCATDAEWQSLVHAIGSPGWAQAAKFDTACGRVANVDELERELGAWTAARTADEITSALQAAGVAASPLMDVDENTTHEHFLHREAFTEVDDELLGKVLMGGIAWKTQRRALVNPSRGPRMGEHNRKIFCDWLGMSMEDLEKLQQAKVIE